MPFGITRPQWVNGLMLQRRISIVWVSNGVQTYLHYHIDMSHANLIKQWCLLQHIYFIYCMKCDLITIWNKLFLDMRLCFGLWFLFHTQSNIIHAVLSLDLYELTHWGRDKMAAIFQTTFSNAFSWMKMFKFRLRFHWSLFPRVQLIILQHWFRWWLGAGQVTSHYLNQWWLIHWRIYASRGLNELTLNMWGPTLISV